jgi:hypothetical protein
MDITTGLKVLKLVEVAKNICVTVFADDPDPDLPDDLLVLLKSFKQAYDSKDAAMLARSLSDEYAGSLWGYDTKKRVMSFFDENFRFLPTGLGLRLKVTVLKTRVDDAGVARVTVDFDSKISLLRIPVTKFDLGRVVVTAHFDDDRGVYRITRLDSAA